MRVPRSRSGRGCVNWPGANAPRAKACPGSSGAGSAPGTPRRPRSPRLRPEKLVPGHRSLPVPGAVPTCVRLLHGVAVAACSPRSARPGRRARAPRSLIPGGRQRAGRAGEGRAPPRPLPAPPPRRCAPSPPPSAALHLANPPAREWTHSRRSARAQPRNPAPPRGRRVSRVHGGCGGPARQPPRPPPGLEWFVPGRRGAFPGPPGGGGGGATAGSGRAAVGLGGGATGTARGSEPGTGPAYVGRAGQDRRGTVPGPLPPGSPKAAGTDSSDEPGPRSLTRRRGALGDGVIPVPAEPPCVSVGAAPVRRAAGRGDSRLSNAGHTGGNGGTPSRAEVTH